MEIHRPPKVLGQNGFDFESVETCPNENADHWAS